MKFSMLSAAAAVFASAASASPVAARNGPHAVANIIAVNEPVSGEHSRVKFSVPFGSLTSFDNDVTGFELDSVTVNNVPFPGDNDVSVDNVVCRRYKDVTGTQAGSTSFTKTEPALISTNPVSFGWVLCYVHHEGV